MRKDGYARVWSSRKSQNGNSCSVQLSVSKKNKETNQYESEFSNYVTFAGEAAKNISQMNIPEKFEKGGNFKGTSIRLGDFSVRSYYDERSYKKLERFLNGNEDALNTLRQLCNRNMITVWSFSPADSSTPAPSNNSNSKKPAAKSNDFSMADDDDADLPF